MSLFKRPISTGAGSDHSPRMSKCNAKTAAGLVIFYQGKMRLISLAQFPGQIKPEPGSGLVCGEKGFEHRISVLGCNARALVADINIGSLSVLSCPRMDADSSLPRVLFTVA